MNPINFTLARDKCVHCNACINDCPRNIIQNAGGFPGITPENETQCIRCQHCLAVCPTGAVSILGLDPANSLPLAETPPVSAEAMRQFVHGRRTTRQYHKHNVDRALIDRLLADTAHAPTGGNTCDLTFIVVDDRQKLAVLLDGITAGLERFAHPKTPLQHYMKDASRRYRATGADEIFRGAPHLLIASAGEAAYCGDADVVIALSYFELLAHSSGLGTTWCDFLKFIFDAMPELAAPFGLPLNRPFRAMLFGLPSVHYSRTVQRDRAAQIKTI